jgi:hypothetical protein
VKAQLTHQSNPFARELGPKAGAISPPWCWTADKNQSRPKQRPLDRVETRHRGGLDQFAYPKNELVQASAGEATGRRDPSPPSARFLTRQYLEDLYSSSQKLHCAPGHRERLRRLGRNAVGRDPASQRGRAKAKRTRLTTQTGEPGAPGRRSPERRRPLLPQHASSCACIAAPRPAAEPEVQLSSPCPRTAQLAIMCGRPREGELLLAKGFVMQQQAAVGCVPPRPGTGAAQQAPARPLAPAADVASRTYLDSALSLQQVCAPISGCLTRFCWLLLGKCTLVQPPFAMWPLWHATRHQTTAHHPTPAPTP